MLSSRDFKAGYKVEDGKMVIQFVFKPLIGEIPIEEGKSEEETIELLKKEMNNALNTMVFAEVRSALFMLCADTVGTPLEAKIQSFIQNLNIDLSEMDIKKTGEDDGEESSEEEK